MNKFSRLLVRLVGYDDEYNLLSVDEFWSTFAFAGSTTALGLIFWFASGHPVFIAIIAAGVVGWIAIALGVYHAEPRTESDS